MTGNTARESPGLSAAIIPRVAPTQPAPAPEAVQAQLDKLCSLKTFSRSKDLCRFLRFVVEQTLRNRTVRLKEYLIGVAVFDRGESYNPGTDPIVRVQARRLRAKLNDYYNTEGCKDAIQIDLPSGGYVPVFRYRQAAASTSEATAVASATGDALMDDMLDICGQVPQPNGILYRRPLSPAREGVLNAPFSNDARHLCRRGQFCLHQATPETIRVGMECFECAVEADPGYAPAYAGLAGTYAVAGILGTCAPHEATSRTKALAAKAINLDERLAEAWAARGLVMAACDRDFQGAESEFLEALDRGPGLAAIHQWYAIGALLPLGRIEQAVVELKVALEFGPPSPSIQTDLAWVFYLGCRQQEALEHCWYALDASPGFYRAHLVLGSIYESQGQLEKALAAYDRAAQVSGTRPLASVIGAQGHACGRVGRKEEAAKYLAALLEQVGGGGTALAAATVHLGLGELDRTFEWLHRAANEQDCGLIWLNRDPRYAHLRGDGRFQALLCRLHVEG